MSKMDALVYEGPSELNMRSVPIPEPAEGEVLIQVSRVGICGSELSGYLGHNSLRFPPLIMGHEFAGTVARTGGDVVKFSVGDRVTVNPLISCGQCRWCRIGAPQQCSDRQIIGAHRPGAFAEYVIAPASNVIVLPDEVTMDQGALTEPLACAVHIGRLANLNRLDRLLIYGAGPIGILTMLTAKVYGLIDVVVMDLNRERLKVVEENGGIAVNSANQLLKIAPKDGFDITVDAVGVDAIRKQAVELTRRGGKVVFSGLHEAESQIPINVAIRNEITMHGAFCYDTQDFETALDWLREDKVNLWNHTDLTPLADGKACFEKLLTSPDKSTKIMLRVRD